jgi:hypothetical protein
MEARYQACQEQGTEQSSQYQPNCTPQTPDKANRLSQCLLMTLFFYVGFLSGSPANTEELLRVVVDSHESLSFQQG